jgi:hypothetical protein
MKNRHDLQKSFSGFTGAGSAKLVGHQFRWSSKL